MAYAGALFADACLRGLNGEPDVEEYSFVESNIVPELTFFSSKVKLGPNGARPSGIEMGSHQYRCCDAPGPYVALISVEYY
jgi:hypothetical protein